MEEKQNDAQSPRSQYRRMPAVPRSVSGINPEKDIRVRITGRVIDRLSGSFILDDGTGNAEIVVENAESVPDVVRVFCRVLPLESGYELRAEVVQDLSDFDLELLKKIQEIRSR